MKTLKFITAGIVIAFVALLSSCEENGEVTPDLNDSEFVSQNILLSSNSALSRVRSFGFGGPMGALYGGYASTQGGRVSLKPSQLFNAHAKGRNAEDENYCMSETWYDDGDGNYKFMIDFGDGCDYYGYWMFGKMEEVGSYSDNSFSSVVTYTNFGGSDDNGGEDWSIDGTHSYSGTWEDFEEDATDDDSLWIFSATYEFSADLTEKYMEYGYYDDSTDVSTGEQLIVIDYKANGSESMDHLGFTINSRSEEVEINTGESFTSNVDTPLFYDYACENDEVWVFVSGRESGSYTYDGMNGTYSIDYGDGACDNIITVTENGVTEEIDLGEEWEEWEDECGDDHEEDEGEDDEDEG